MDHIALCEIEKDFKIQTKFKKIFLFHLRRI